MDENKNINSTADKDTVAFDSVVTEADVVAALSEAELTSAPTDPQQEDTSSERPVVDPEEQIVTEVAAKRNDHIQNFQLDFSLGDIPDAEGMKREENEEVPVRPTISDVPVRIEEEDEEEEDEKPKSSGGGCLAKIIFTLIVLALSCLLAFAACKMIFGVTGWNGTDEEVVITVPAGANTVQVAETLNENGLIEDVWCFRLYSRLIKADGTWHSGEYTLQSDMGFATMIETLQVAPVRETVKVMLREGLTIDEMSDILDENRVCTKQEFLDAVINGEYDYEFVKQIPIDGDYAQRVYRLEGYLFPDTYEFFTGSSGEEVVDKMLGNFQSKLTSSLLDKIEKQGWTIDQAITFASMVQGEGDTRANMDKVSRVLHNRLDPKSGFKKLELCCTRDYANDMLEIHDLSSEELHQVYNTYKREGFPIGPIGNPGMDALLAAVNPSEDEQIMKCYYFATDYKTGITYFSKTYQEHQNTINKYGIEDLG